MLSLRREMRLTERATDTKERSVYFGLTSDMCFFLGGPCIIQLVMGVEGNAVKVRSGVDLFF